MPGTVPARELAEEAIPVPGGVGPIGPAKARLRRSGGPAEAAETGRSGQPAFEPSPGGGRGLPDARPMPGRAFPHLCRGADRHQGRAGQSFPALVPSGISGQASEREARAAGGRRIKNWLRFFGEPLNDKIKIRKIFRVLFS